MCVFDETENLHNTGCAFDEKENEREVPEALRAIRGVKKGGERGKLVGNVYAVCTFLPG